MSLNERLSEERLIEEEEILRPLGVEGALGHNSSDYLSMWNLFTQIIERANSMNADPNAFFLNGNFNDKTLNAWTKMISTAKGILEGLNKMRNADKMIANLLEEHTKLMAQAVCVQLAIELKTIIGALERDKDTNDAAALVRRLMNRRLPEIFLKAATSTLSTARQEYGLLQ